MNCPHCTSDKIVKNGHCNGKQSYLCRDCRCQFQDNPQQGYSQEVKALCVTMSLNGMGFRVIERVTGINHNSVINMVATQDPISGIGGSQSQVVAQPMLHRPLYKVCL